MRKTAAHPPVNDPASSRKCKGRSVVAKLVHCLVGGWCRELLDSPLNCLYSATRQLQPGLLGVSMTEVETALRHVRETHRALDAVRRAAERQQRKAQQRRD